MLYLLQMRWENQKGFFYSTHSVCINRCEHGINLRIVTLLFQTYSVLHGAIRKTEKKIKNASMYTYPF